MPLTIRAQPQADPQRPRPASPWTPLAAGRGGCQSPVLRGTVVSQLLSLLFYLTLTSFVLQVFITAVSSWSCLDFTQAE